MFKYVGIALVGLILWLFFQKQEKDYATLLTLVICIIGVTIACQSLTPVLDFVRQLKSVSGMQDDVIEALLKAVGISVTTEIAGMICGDAGNAALQKTIKMVGTMTILTLSVPVFQVLLSLVQEILGKL